ncbi:hypothetical protein M2114_001219 [Aurantimicrobium minutum]|uniref:hypothetical protein n=1 Tax=Aurantimicrobium minutum TaxID=708131 RepID=UPI0024756B6A|nr:hypothetical protein [Aurantimicrobium minutum]MDH6425102.1 hypothetical protein [Aurantimicrobium minutum]
MVTRLQVKVKTFFIETQEMSENSEQNPTNQGLNSQEQTRRNPLVSLLGVLVSLEALLVTAGAVYFLSRIFLETPENLSGAFVIFAITLIIAAGLISTAIGTFKAKPWTRGAILTWQIMQFVVATSFIQGILAWQPVGWVLILFSVGTAVLLFTRPVISAMTAEK